MSLKKMLAVLAGITLLALSVIYIRFLNISQKEVVSEPSTKTIRVLAPYEINTHREILEQAGEEFSKKEGNPQVVFEFVAREHMKKELSLRSLAGKDKIDMVICVNTLMPELIHMNLLKEITVEDKLYQRVSQKKLWNSTRDDGKFYGVPFNCDPYVLFYKRDKMAELNLDYPKTWDELEKAARKMKKMGIRNIGIPGKRTDELASIFKIMLYSSGGNFLSIDQEAGVQVFEEIQRLSVQNLIEKEMMNYTQEDLAREFASGKMNFMINQLSVAGILRNGKIASNIGVVRLAENMAESTFLHGENIGLVTDAAPEAEDFLEYLIEAETNEKICSVMDTIPVFSDVPYHKKATVCVDDAQKLLSEGRALEMYSTWTKMSEKIAQGIYKVIEINMSNPEEIASEVGEKVWIAIMEGEIFGECQ